LLTIYNNDKSTLQKQVAELTKKSQEENYIIQEKLAEKEREIEATAREADQTKQKMQEMQDMINTLTTNVASLTEAIANLDKKDGEVEIDPADVFIDPDEGIHINSFEDEVKLQALRRIAKNVKRGGGTRQ